MSHHRPEPHRAAGPGAPHGAPPAAPAAAPITVDPGRPVVSDADAGTGALLLRVLSTLLREDAYGLRSGARTVRRSDGDWLRLDLPDGPALLPVEADGFQCEVRARRPVLETGGGTLVGLRAVLGRLRSAVQPVDLPGFDAFLAECEEEAATLRQHAAARPDVLRALTARHGPCPGPGWRGLAGSLGYDTLAAHRDHPLYPTSRARPGLDAAGLRAHAPEFAPEFALNWLAVPRTALRYGAGPLPDWWPTPRALGLTGLDVSHQALPVHPLTVGPHLTAALRAVGLTGRAERAVLAPRRWLRVRPTLSMRTVAVVDDPTVHLKLPLATATLGLRNRRTIKPGTLADGAAGQRLTAALVARETRFAGAVLLADERTYLHAGHELIAALVRRYPAGLDRADVVPLAALFAPRPDGAPVIDALVDRYYAGDLLAFVDAYATLLFDWHTTVFGYGVALEAHQQNTSLVLDEAAGGPRLRLLIKDHDGPRVFPARLAARLARGAARPSPGRLPATQLPSAPLPSAHTPPEHAPSMRPAPMQPPSVDPPSVHPAPARPTPVAPSPASAASYPAGAGLDPYRLGFDDARILVDGDGPVVDVFTTITVHLCAGAIAFELARLGRAPLGTLLDLFRARLSTAIDHLPADGPQPATGPQAAPGDVLRARVLLADRLPVKAMVTAGTLLAKERSGAADVNKHYVSGPNYLLRTSRWSR